MPPRVLVVEDEVFVSLEMQAALQDAGYQVAGAAVSAEEALRLAEQERPDLILMDVRLAGVRDGIDAAAQVHDRFGIPVLIVTGNADASTRERARAAGAAGFLSKPFVAEQLIASVAACLPADRA